MPDKTSRTEEVAKYAENNGYDSAAEKFGITKEAVRRYCRKVKQTGKTLPESDISVLRKLRSRLSDEEIKLLANGTTKKATDNEIFDFSGEEIIIGYCTDTHIGSKYFHDSIWNSFIQECKKQKVSMILHTGDITEGMSGRPGQVYELEDIGFTAQMDHAERLLHDLPVPFYFIDGNHDRWGIKVCGLSVGDELAKRIPGIHFLGHDRAVVDINGTKWELWHGLDGSSSSISLRVQKIIDTIPTNNLPDVLLCGHTHKQISFTYRGVNAVSGGSIEKQTDWMAGNRLTADVGFYIIKAGIRNGKITYFCPCWYPIAS